MTSHTHYCVSFPLFPDGVNEEIEAIRERFDTKNFEVLSPHLPLVFRLQHFDDSQVEAEVLARIPGHTAIELTFESVQVIERADSDFSDVFLIVNEGMEEVIALHDELYVGAFSSQLRLDVPFVPHITVGRSDDRELLMECVKEVYQSELLPFAAHLDSLTILRDYGDHVTEVVTFELPEAENDESS